MKNLNRTEHLLLLEPEQNRTIVYSYNDFAPKQRSLAGCMREKNTAEIFALVTEFFYFIVGNFSLFCVYGYHEDTLTILLLHITNQHFTQCTSVYLLTSYKLDYLF